MSIEALQRKRGMTFVEVVVAIGIAAFVSIGLYGSAIFTMRQTAASIEHIHAVQIANSAAARLRAARYDKLAAAPSTLGTTEFEKQFSQTSIISTDPNKGPGNSELSTTFSLAFKLKGFGKGVSGSGLTATLSIPAHGASWAANEFAGRFLVIVSGKGSNQVMLITSHGASTGAANAAKSVTVNLNKNLDGTSGGGGWDIQPDSTSSFAIDYGMYCEAEVQWGNGNSYRTVMETVYVPAG